MRRSNPYNARHIAASEVAKSFVIPDNFINIAEFDNILLIGPRGSGKTTILKALTSAGLFYLFQREDLNESLANLAVDYFPVYIPAETNWKGDALAIYDAIPHPSQRNHILNGLFVDHSLYELVRSLEDSRKFAELLAPGKSTHWAIPITSEQEEVAARHLSDLWKLPRIQTSFLGLKLALIARSNDYRAPITTPSPKALEHALSLPTLDILQMLKGVMDIMQEIRSDTMWSFNFDEMEIAPKHVVSMLYENLRSWDQRAVLKFSLYPYVDFYSLEEKLKSSDKGPVEGPDYQAFSLTNTFKRKPSEFTKELVESECRKRNLDSFAFARYLNSSRAIKPNSRKFDGLKTERNFEAIFKTTFSSKTDSGLISFLHNRGFNSDAELNAVKGETNRAAHIRKIAPIVEFRNYYLTEHRSNKAKKAGRTARKGFGYYHGYEKIFALTEGNPRAIKFYVNDLLNALQAGEPSSTAQNRVISQNVDRFRSLVASQVVPIEGDGEIVENTLNFSDRLGHLFVEGILGDTFKSEPPLSVKFNNLQQQTKRIVEIAVNSGALVVDRSTNESTLVFDIENQRLRLSHSFAPFHPLPTITGPSIKLSELPVRASRTDDQSDLFRWNS